MLTVRRGRARHTLKHAASPWTQPEGSQASHLQLCGFTVNSARRQPGFTLTAMWLHRELSPKAARLSTNIRVASP